MILQEITIPELEIYTLESNKDFNKYKPMIEASGLRLLNKNIEFWTSSSSNKSLAYLSHGIFRYFGKFPPPIARHLIKEYTQEGDLLLDTMCGSGTTGLEALLLNRRAYCYDINPLSLLISNVKITKIDKDKAQSILKNLIKMANKNALKNYEITLPGLRDQYHWFLKETINSLASIQEEIKKIKPQEMKNLFEVAFLSIVRKVSKATTQQGRLFLDIETAQKDAVPVFHKKANELIDKLSQLPENKNVTVSYKSILENSLTREEAKLIICHPPYFNSYKYSSINSLELSWLNIDHGLIRKHEVREAFKVGKAEKVKDYLNDMEAALRNNINSLQGNGVLALMIGDTIIKGEYIQVTKMLVDRLSDILEIDKIVFRIPQFTEASWAASQRRKGINVGINLCDIIIIFRKLGTQE